MLVVVFLIKGVITICNYGKEKQYEASKLAKA